ncbi:MAG TPA: VWA domain-containing protein [Bryobacteraceae bacterium]|nr:VWA domain-containing protein [Bryobacteraceae bacterium]
MPSRWCQITLVAAFAAIGAWSQTQVRATGGDGKMSGSGRDTTVPRTSARGAKPAIPRPEGGPGPSVTLLGSVATASPAESVALNGNVAYVCDDNEISVVNVANPSALQVTGTVTNPLIQTSGISLCAVQRSTLSVFADQVSTKIPGPGPVFLAFSLTVPTSPQVIAGTSLTKRFFQQPLYMGNYAFVPTSSLEFFLQFQWDNQYGDLVSMDLTNFGSPKVASTLEQPVPGLSYSQTYGGPTQVFGVTQVSSSLLYIGGSTSTNAANNGAGRLQTVDVSNPQAIKLVGQMLIPGTLQFAAPLIQGTTAVGIGNNGGVGNNGSPPAVGNIVVTTFDVSDPRQPTILSINTTSYKVGTGGGATPIGNNLFAFAGVVDSNNNNVLLIVDATNPSAPVIESVSIPTPFTNMQAVGTTLYATLGPSGFAAYSIPGISSTPPSFCPASVDAMLVIDRGANIPSQAFFNAETALEAFISTLHLPSDQVGVVSFTTAATVNQTLTNNAAQADSAISSIVPGGTSYIGSGIAAAQAELASPRHNPAATPMIVVLSDGVDVGAPNPTATLAAANTAKTAGIQIISLQYGTGSTSRMQSIASSASNFYQVPQ